VRSTVSVGGGRSPLSFDHMNSAYVATLILFAYSCGYAGDPKAPGDMSDHLLLGIAFQPRSKTAAESFRITLQNKSTNDVMLQVQPNRFQGSIVLTSKGREPKEYYDKEFRRLLLTALWVDPFEKLPKGDAIVWNVPITNLRDVHDHRPILQELNGASAYATLKRVAIAPPSGSFISSNAKQTSGRITIQFEQDGAANGSQPIRSETNRTSSAAGSRR